MSPLTIIEAKKRIFEQEIPLPIKKSGWKLFRHETEKGVSLKKSLDNILAWMLIQYEREEREKIKISTIQKRILYLIIVDGYTQAQAAIHLDRSRETVKQYCITLRKSLGVDSFYQVVAIAVERGWVPPPSITTQK